MPRFPASAASAGGLSDRVYGGLVARARARTGTTHLLQVGDTYLDPLPGARAESQLCSDHPRLHSYAPVQGEPVLLDAILARLEGRSGTRPERERVQVTSGATGGLTVVCSTLLDPGDEVIVLAPYWPLIRGIVASRNALPVELPFYDRLADSGFDPRAALEGVVTPRTVAVYVNSPNNPTGKVLTEAAMEAIASVVLDHGLWLVADEAYEDLCYVEPRPPPIWACPTFGERTIACHTLSKSYGLAGARVGYVHGPKAIMAAVRGMQTFLTYCAPRPMQLGAARALTEGDSWLAEARRAYREAGRRASAALGLPPPEGGTFLFFDASPYLGEREPVEVFLERCLDEGVLLTPGGASGADYGRWARLCFTAVPPDELDDALLRLKRVLGSTR